jgi:hypothetical protein
MIGCGSAEKTVAVRGSVQKGGKPYTFTTQGLPPGDTGFRLEFTAQTAQGAGERFSAAFNAADGTFKVSKANATGLPAGTYRISLHRGAFGGTDEFKGAFSAEKTPLKVEIPASASGVEITIDLDAKTATVK